MEAAAVTGRSERRQRQADAGRRRSSSSLVALVGGSGRATRRSGRRRAGAGRSRSNDTTMPHLHDVVQRLLGADAPPAARRSSTRCSHAALVHGEGGDRRLPARRRRSASRSRVALAQSRLLERGLLPYVVASQTVPILAIAPMVVDRARLEGRRRAGSPVAILAAYLTFFPVAINTLRGLHRPIRARSS